MAGGLIPFEEYVASILSRIEPMPAEPLPLTAAHGLVLAKDVRSPIDLPSFPSSAMDGFAVRSADIAAAREQEPARLRSVGEVRMGHRPEVVVEEGTAVRIPTGGAVPEGADAIAPIEVCALEGDTVLVAEPLPAGKHLRPAGEDLRAGATLVGAGRDLGAPEVGLLASAGLGEVEAHRRPRVLVISTGDELVAPGTPLSYGQVYDANAHTLYAAVREAGAEAVLGGIVPDEPDRLRLELEAHLTEVDAVITSGGVSVGERDVLKAAFAAGGELEFRTVAMQPGKPQGFGLVGGKPFFALPGNTVSVFVSFEVIVRPALRRMLGSRNLHRPEIEAVLDTALSGPEGRTRFARVRLSLQDDGWHAHAVGGHQSNLLSAVARAHGLAVTPQGAPNPQPGDRCRVRVFRSLDHVL